MISLKCLSCSRWLLLILYSFFFFVPSRLVYDKWVNLCGEQENPEDSTDYLVPTVSLSGDMTNKIPDYMGIACASGSFNNISVNCLPFRAYWLIWNEWFRDENLQKSVKVSKGESNTVLEPMGQSTPNPHYGLPSGVSNWFDPAPRGKRYDYFCGALPWPQKGESVDLPLGASATISQVSPGTGYVAIGTDSYVGYAIGPTNETASGKLSSRNQQSVTLRSSSNENSVGGLSSSGTVSALNLNKFLGVGSTVDLSSASAPFIIKVWNSC